jgi:hypothetical protein
MSEENKKAPLGNGGKTKDYIWEQTLKYIT